jgi:hypothetical protein
LAVASVEELDTRSYDATITYRCTPPATVSQGQSESHTQATSRNLSVTFCASRALFPMNARSRLSLPRSMRHARPCGQCRVPRQWSFVLSRTYTTNTCGEVGARAHFALCSASQASPPWAVTLALLLAASAVIAAVILFTQHEHLQGPAGVIISEGDTPDGPRHRCGAERFRTTNPLWLYISRQAPLLKQLG